MLAVRMDAKAGPLCDCKPEERRKYNDAIGLPFEPGRGRLLGHRSRGDRLTLAAGLSGAAWRHGGASEVK